MNEEPRSHKKGRIKRRLVKFLVVTGSVLAVYSGLAYLFVWPPLTKIIECQVLATTAYRWDILGQRVGEADAAEIFTLEGFSGQPPKEKKFLGHPFTSTIRIQGDDLRAISTGWSETLWVPGGGYLCHNPAYGIRFYKQGNIIAEVAICWSCHNITIESPVMHGLYPFDAQSDHAIWLLKRLQSLAPTPEITKP